MTTIVIIMITIIMSNQMIQFLVIFGRYNCRWQLIIHDIRNTRKDKHTRYLGTTNQRYAEFGDTKNNTATAVKRREQDEILESQQGHFMKLLVSFEFMISTNEEAVWEFPIQSNISWNEHVRYTSRNLIVAWESMLMI